MAEAEVTARTFKTAWFAKANIGDDELEDFRTLAKSYATLNDEQFARLLQDKDLAEICHGDEK